MLSLKLFNVVEAKGTLNSKSSIDLDNGIVIAPGAVWATKQIQQYLKEKTLSGEQLNATFHKSWNKVIESSPEELRAEQLMHYVSGYGDDFITDEVYIPDEVLDVPEANVKLVVIRAMHREDIIAMVYEYLNSGIALAQTTLDDVFNLLDEMGHTPTKGTSFRNKEANIKLAHLFGIYPSDPVDALRFIAYCATDSTLLIKNEMMTNAITDYALRNESQVSDVLSQVGLKEMAQVFNRFKPLFMAMRHGTLKPLINKISKLSKVHHKPLVQNPLNQVTSRKLTDADQHWLDNATVFAMFKAMSVCHTHINGRTAVTYHIRNGKSWTKDAPRYNKDVLAHNYSVIREQLKTRINSDAVVYIPDHIKYALPTSEKKFVGNLPIGTKIVGDDLAVGVYWENKWGANDLDLSALNICGKIGWDASYHSHLSYSGDITSAPNGAAEYIYSGGNVFPPSLINLNVYSGNDNSKFKLIVGSIKNVKCNHMLSPNEVIFEQMMETVQLQMVIGLMLPTDYGKQSLTILNMGTGQMPVSRWGEIPELQLKAQIEEYMAPPTVNDLLTEMGISLTDNVDDATIDLSVDKLSKTTFVDLFTK